MRVIAKKTEDDVLKTLFEPLSKAVSSPTCSWIQVQPTWCQASESRLFSKLIEHKPAGISKHFHLMALTDYMNNIYEDEDTDFEELLSMDDLLRLRKRRHRPETDNTLVFKPKYRIRPTPDQVMEKINELWNMQIIEHNEYIHEGFEVQSEFFLPDGEYSELLKKKEEWSSSGPSRKKARRGGSHDSLGSRCSTPANKN